jgi:hypothetical protein
MPAIMRPTDPQTAAELVRSRHGARISSPQPPPTDLEQIEAHFGSRPRSSSAADREWSVSFVMPMRSVVSIRWPVLPRPHGDCGGPATEGCRPVRPGVPTRPRHPSAVECPHAPPPSTRLGQHAGYTQRRRCRERCRGEHYVGRRRQQQLHLVVPSFCPACWTSDSHNRLICPPQAGLGL